MEVPDGWEKRVGEELRKSLPRYLRDGFADRYLSGSKILDIGYKGYLDKVEPILPHAIGVDLDYPGYDGKRLPFPDASQDSVFTSHTLEHISEYRSAIADWFRVLRIGGFLIIVVPDQFLYERKRSLPSKWNRDHKRFYTCASLLAEVEESIDAFAYRVRLLEQNDRGFDYSIPPDQEATGCREIVLVIESIERPSYSDAVLSDSSDGPASEPLNQLPPPFDDRDAPIIIIESSAAVPRRIITLQLGHRGDFIMASPALRLLRQQFTSAEITLVCGSWNVTSAHELGVVDNVIPFDLFNEATGGIRSRSSFDELAAEFSRLMSGQSYDLAIDMRVHEATRPLLNVISANQRCGFGSTGEYPFLDIALPCPRPTIAGRAVHTLLRPERFNTNFGRRDHNAIVFAEQLVAPPSEILVSGPYVRLDPGHYTIEILVEPLGSESDLDWDITANGGNDVLANGPLPVRHEPYPKVQLTLSEVRLGIEIRMRAGHHGHVQPFRFLGCQVQKGGQFAGPHQQELQALLVHLVALRMYQPYEMREANA